MRIGEHEFPDECPKDCTLIGDLSRFGQNSICGRCPVFVCSGEDPLVPPDEYRVDWSEEWARFFASKNIFRPVLPLVRKDR